jgi:hypothetical protein
MGFVDFAMPWTGEVYADAPQQSWAADYGTIGVNYRANRIPQGP